MLSARKKSARKKTGKPEKLQTRLFRYILLPSALVLACLTVLFCVYSSRLLIQREQDTLQTLSDSIKNQVENKLNGLDNVSSNINYYNRKHPFLTGQMNTDLNTTRGRLIINYLQIANGLDYKADQINLYGLSGSAIEMGKITKNYSFTADEVPWMDEVLDLKGKKMIGTPYQTTRYSTGNTDADWYLSLFRATLDSQNQTIGVTETIGTCKHIFQGILNYQNTADNPAQICIFDSSGTLIYPYQTDSSESQRYGSYYSVVKNRKENSGSLTDPQTGIHGRYAVSVSQYSGWTYLILQPNAVILQPVYQMLRLILAAALPLLLTSVLVSLLLSRNLARPVEHLKHVVQRMQLDTLGQERITDYIVPYQELDDLYQQFQIMSDSLHQSLQELETAKKLELNSRVLALQSQMNPHFYYNTLACISILAENGETEEVAAMCQKLSSIMRYITNPEESEVTLEKEFRYLEEYMYCMKVRYQDSLRFRISLREAMREIRIPKLSIQPLVENAVKYGTGSLPPWSICVDSFMGEDQWYVTVTDSGKGFDETVIQQLRQRLADVDAHPEGELAKLKIGGMGIVNVYIRWQMDCRNETAIFDFGNTSEGHAFVRIGRQKNECRQTISGSEQKTDEKKEE